MPVYSEIHNRICGASCAVIGLGISNIPLVDYLLSHGAKSITVRDKNQQSDSLKHIRRFKEAGVNFKCGDDYLKELNEDILFRSPGIRPWEKEISEACQRGALLSSEMELFFELCPCKIIGITGSDGKTTTTTLTSLIAKEEFSKSDFKRNVFVGGNIGTPLISAVDKMTENDLAIVELSSFQLYTMKKSPDVAVITNLSPNHLDWHVDFDDYCEAKYNIFSGKSCKLLVTNADNKVTSNLASICPAPISWFSSGKSKDELPDNCYFVENGIIKHKSGKISDPVLDVSEIKLRGKHNIENFMSAIAALGSLVSKDSIEKVARSFNGVEHRIEFVKEIHGVKYYNSSIDSSPSRTIAAIRSFDERLVVICCGRDKHVPFNEMADELCLRADCVIIFGEIATALKDSLLSSQNYKSNRPLIIETSDLENAVRIAHDRARAPQSVLLSPGGTSFDLYKNFEARGKHFKELVSKLS